MRSHGRHHLRQATTAVLAQETPYGNLLVPIKLVALDGTIKTMDVVNPLAMLLLAAEFPCIYSKRGSASRFPARRPRGTSSYTLMKSSPATRCRMTTDGSSGLRIGASNNSVQPHWLAKMHGSFSCARRALRSTRS